MRWFVQKAEFQVLKNRFVLTFSFHLVFWLMILVWLGVAAKSASPQPDNWELLELVSNLALGVALLALGVSAYVGLAAEKRLSGTYILGAFSLLLALVASTVGVLFHLN
jgi:hypothetical protein